MMVSSAASEQLELTERQTDAPERTAAPRANWRRSVAWLVQQTVPELRRQQQQRHDAVDGAFGVWNDDKEVTRIEDSYTCCPPPVFIPVITVAQIITFCVYAARLGDVTFNKGGVDFNSPLIYDPKRRKEVWRFLSYCLLHSGVYHILVNLLMQLTFGLVLETQHKLWRVLPVFLLGTVSGALASSVFDPSAAVVGGSGGVYALMGAHVATVLINWREMQRDWTKSALKFLFSGAARLAIILLILGSDTGMAIHARYVSLKGSQISYATHFGSFVAGVLVGVIFLRNLKIRRFEKILCVVCLSIFILLFVGSIIFNCICLSYSLCPAVTL